ncbi:uncharacterized protein LOC132174710 [Corylus avellana]|uniref:uncharacterized protein LOC132174710 n=1 Tax=Corylus avellana TaxID=13451 RepID=UPI001E22D861|nr:uncharacterized protein LOC132174710 [Corylus avellana]
MGGRLFPLSISFRPSPTKHFKAASAAYNSVKSYSQASKENGHGREFIEERAPSTAEEFKNIAEEKIREAQQGVASQTAEKVFDGTEAATLGDADDLQSVNRRYEEHEEGADYRRRSGDQSDGVKAFSNKAE